MTKQMESVLAVWEAQVIDYGKKTSKETSSEQPDWSHAVSLRAM
jgi:hypothetical protein